MQTTTNFKFGDHPLSHGDTFTQVVFKEKLDICWSLFGIKGEWGC